MAFKFDNWADCWEKHLKKGHISVKNYIEKESRFLLENVPEKCKAVEVGCGDGRVLLLLAKKVSEIVGVDFNSEVLCKAKEKIVSFNNIQLICRNFLDNGLEESSFDCCIFSYNTFGNFHKDKEKILKEAIRVTKSGGKIFISVYSEKALAERIKHYTGIYRFKIIDKEKGMMKIFCSFDGVNPIITEQFSKERLSKIFAKVGLTDFKIEQLTEISYICSITVKK